MSFFNEVEKRFDHKISSATEGFQIAVLKNNHLVFKENFGKTYRYYDLASLTKILYTVSAIQFLNEFELLMPDHSVKDYISDWKNPNTKIKHLLTHTAGLDWWQPFYKKIPRALPIEEKKHIVYDHIVHSKSKLTKKSQYSDLDFILLNALIEKSVGMPSEEFSKVLFECIDSPELFFQKNNRLKYKISDYAPTEKCPWRNKQLQGQVHDDNTWAMGGVSGHAGLFGSLEAVIQWSQYFYQSLHNNEDSWSRASTIQSYCHRAISKSRGDWALGYMMPTEGRASCGRHFSKASIGHTGFVGTSFWHDPKNKFTVIVLSNRVFPTRENQLFVKLRPILHDVAFELFN
ncbi:MAG: serine hydrolase [Bdellovibrionales bacterium]|nr:serine hydrolase [Bdellovibrionales bacterium]